MIINPRVPLARRRAHLVRAVVAAGLATTTFSACIPSGGGGPAPAPTTATVSLSTSWPSSGAPKCTDLTGATWGATPVSVQGSIGQTTEQKATDSAHGEFLPSGESCTISHVFTQLAPGRWRLWVVAGVASGACEKDVTAGYVVAPISGSTC